MPIAQARTTWLMRSVSTPQNSSVRAMVSPMMVLRRWPTCISFATFGELKSTTARRAGSRGAHGPMPWVGFKRALNINRVQPHKPLLVVGVPYALVGYHWLRPQLSWQ